MNVFFFTVCDFVHICQYHINRVQSLRQSGRVFFEYMFAVTLKMTTKHAPKWIPSHKISLLSSLGSTASLQLSVPLEMALAFYTHCNALTQLDPQWRIMVLETCCCYSGSRNL